MDVEDAAFASDSLETEDLQSWTTASVVESGANFKPISRISVLDMTPEEVMKTIREYEEKGMPLIVGGWNELDGWKGTEGENGDFFSLEGFVEASTEVTSIHVWNIRKREDQQMALRELIEQYKSLLANDGLSDNEVYGKDLQCPSSWEAWLRSTLPEDLHPQGSNDLIACLPVSARPETLMCYLGIGGTFTRAHKDLCGSIGHNLMCYASEKSSSFWFMTETGSIDEDKPTKYLREVLGKQLDFEEHRVTLEEWKRAPFIVYTGEQRVGDLVLVPPRSCHQVINLGGITLKMAWSRMGIKSLEYSLGAELLVYHRVCRKETYRVKHTLFAAVKEFAHRLKSSTDPQTSSYLPRTRDLANDLHRLINLLDEVLGEEWCPKPHSFKYWPVSGRDDCDIDFLYCDFCGADVFQSFFVCSECKEPNSDSEGFTCCSSCFVEGRSCRCGPANMEPWQMSDFSYLIEQRNTAVKILNDHLEPSSQLCPMTESTLTDAPQLKVFQAACILHQKAKERMLKKRQTMKCRLGPSNPENHEEDALSSLMCSVCHGARCFKHLLSQSGVHVAEALLSDKKDPKRGLHDLHKGPDVSSRSALALRISAAAKVFDSCYPIDSRRANPGFYDNNPFIEAEMPETVTLVPNQGTSSNRALRDSLTPLEDNDLQTTGGSRNEPIPTKKRKRQQRNKMDDLPHPHNKKPR